MSRRAPKWLPRDRRGYLIPILFSAQQRSDIGLALLGGPVTRSAAARIQALIARGILLARKGRLLLSRVGRAWLETEYESQDAEWRMARDGYRTRFHPEYREALKWNERGVFRLGLVTAAMAATQGEVAAR